MQIFDYYPGTLPVILSIPHAGTYVPETILQRFTPAAKQLPDTDWHVDSLYSFARDLGVHILIATHSRYVIDLNRAPNEESLYPGQFTTGLCPTTLFDGQAIYREDMEPHHQDVQARIKTYWQPYHNQLQLLIDELKTKQRVILFDAHSICSQVPKLFAGVLPSLNLGTAEGQSASQKLTAKLMNYCQTSPYSSVLNGRFKGGYITRHYGNPSQSVEAVQLELAQFNYMEESFPYRYNEVKAKELQKVLFALLSILIDS